MSVLKRSLCAGAIAVTCIATVAASPAFAATTRHATSGVSTTATVYSWGDFGSNGPVSPVVSSPTPINGLNGTIKEISTSNSDTYALLTNGTVWAWGAGLDGELGDGGNTNSFTTPVQVQFPSSVKIASLPNPIPYDTALAIDTSGDIWGWGINGSGQLCLGTTSSVLTPQELPFTNVTLATGAGQHASYYANGTLYSCGANNVGELGTGNFQNSLTPVKVKGLPKRPIVELLSSYEDTGILTAQGHYFNWGLNNHGQLGNGKTTNSDVPVKVHLHGNIRQMTVGGKSVENGQTLAIMTDGSLQVWGSNSLGQLDTGNNADQLRPTAITPPSGVTWDSLSSGGSTSFAIDSTGHVWAWGDNGHGELGQGTTGGYVTRALEIPGLSNVTQISGTASNCAAF
jgi:alpha-tubulin suppressor-like RCC1 family protein